MIDAHARGIYSVSLCDSRQLLALCSWDGTSSVWDIGSCSGGIEGLGIEPKRRYILRGHTAAVRCCAFSDEGRWIATGSDDATVRVWDIDDSDGVGCCLLALAAHRGKVIDVAFTECDVTLVSACVDRDIIVWDVAHRGGIRSRFSVPWTFAVAQRVLTFVETPSGNFGLVTLHVNRIGVWPLIDDQDVFDEDEDSRHLGTGDEVFVAVCSSGAVVASQSMRTNAVSIWELLLAESGDSIRHRCIRQFTLCDRAATSRKALGQLLNIDVVEDRPLLVTGHDCGTVGLWNLWSGIAARVIPPSYFAGVSAERVTCCGSVSGLTAFGSWKGKLLVVQWARIDWFELFRLTFDSVSSAELRARERQVDTERTSRLLLGLASDEHIARQHLVDDQLHELLFQVTVMMHSPMLS